MNRVVRILFGLAIIAVVISSGVALAQCDRTCPGGLHNIAGPCMYGPCLTDEHCPCDGPMYPGLKCLCYDGNCWAYECALPN